MVTPEIITLLAPSQREYTAQVIANTLNTVCPMYEIETADIFQEFIANLLEECDEFNCFEENLNYSAQALVEKFGRHRISVADAYKYGRKAGQLADKKAIANILYGGFFGRTRLGNIQPNDGWDFRGSGPIQLTGRQNITAFTIFYNKTFKTSYTVNQMAQFLRNDLVIGIHSACWLFAISKNLLQLAIDDNMMEIVKRINGGLNGLSKRLQYYEQAKKFII